jgi:hypothetical protein
MTLGMLSRRALWGLKDLVQTLKIDTETCTRHRVPQGQGLHGGQVELIVGGRRAGKTEASLKWVEQAVPTSSYPYWSRVLLTVSLNEADRLRGVLKARARGRGWNSTMVGLCYNMVYSVYEWRKTTTGIEPVELLLDNADMYLQEVIGQYRHTLKVVTWTQREGQPEDNIKLLDDKGGCSYEKR